MSTYTLVGFGKSHMLKLLLATNAGLFVPNHFPHLAIREHESTTSQFAMHGTKVIRRSGHKGKNPDNYVKLAQKIHDQLIIQYVSTRFFT